MSRISTQTPERLKRNSSNSKKDVMPKLVATTTFKIPLEQIQAQLSKINTLSSFQKFSRKSNFILSNAKKWLANVEFSHKKIELTTERMMADDLSTVIRLLENKYELDGDNKVIKVFDPNDLEVLVKSRPDRSKYEFFLNKQPTLVILRDPGVDDDPMDFSQPVSYEKWAPDRFKPVMFTEEENVPHKKPVGKSVKIPKHIAMVVMFDENQPVGQQLTISLQKGKSPNILRWERQRTILAVAQSSRLGHLKNKQRRFVGELLQGSQNPCFIVEPVTVKQKLEFQEFYLPRCVAVFFGTNPRMKVFAEREKQEEFETIEAIKVLKKAAGLRSSKTERGFSRIKTTNFQKHQNEQGMSSTQTSTATNPGKAFIKQDSHRKGGPVDFKVNADLHVVKKRVGFEPFLSPRHDGRPETPIEKLNKKQMIQKFLTQFSFEDGGYLNDKPVSLLSFEPQSKKDTTIVHSLKTDGGRDDDIDYGFILAIMHKKENRDKLLARISTNLSQDVVLKAFKKNGDAPVSPAMIIKLVSTFNGYASSFEAEEMLCPALLLLKFSEEIIMKSLHILERYVKHDELLDLIHATLRNFYFYYKGAGAAYFARVYWEKMVYIEGKQMEDPESDGDQTKKAGDIKRKGGKGAKKKKDWDDEKSQFSNAQAETDENGMKPELPVRMEEKTSENILNYLPNYLAVSSKVKKLEDMDENEDHSDEEEEVDFQYALTLIEQQEVQEQLLARVNASSFQFDGKHQTSSSLGSIKTSDYGSVRKTKNAFSAVTLQKILTQFNKYAKTILNNKNPGAAFKLLRIIERMFFKSLPILETSFNHKEVTVIVVTTLRNYATFYEDEQEPFYARVYTLRANELKKMKPETQESLLNFAPNTKAMTIPSPIVEAKRVSFDGDILIAWVTKILGDTALQENLYQRVCPTGNFDDPKVIDQWHQPFTNFPYSMFSHETIVHLVVSFIRLADTFVEQDRIEARLNILRYAERILTKGMPILEKYLSYREVTQLVCSTLNSLGEYFRDINNINFSSSYFNKANDIEQMVASEQLLSYKLKWQVKIEEQEEDSSEDEELDPDEVLEIIEDYHETKAFLARICPNENYIDEHGFKRDPKAYKSYAEVYLRASTIVKQVDELNKQAVDLTKKEPVVAHKLLKFIQCILTKAFPILEKYSGNGTVVRLVSKTLYNFADLNKATNDELMHQTYFEKALELEQQQATQLLLNYEPDLSFDTVETIINYEYIEAHGEDDETLDAEFIQQLLKDDSVKIQLLKRIQPDKNFSELKLMLPIRSQNSILRPQQIQIIVAGLIKFAQDFMESEEEDSCIILLKYAEKVLTKSIAIFEKWLGTRVLIFKMMLLLSTYANYYEKVNAAKVAEIYIEKALELSRIQATYLLLNYHPVWTEATEKADLTYEQPNLDQDFFRRLIRNTQALMNLVSRICPNTNFSDWSYRNPNKQNFRKNKTLPLSAFNIQLIILRASEVAATLKTGDISDLERLVMAQQRILTKALPLLEFYFDYAQVMAMVISCLKNQLNFFKLDNWAEMAQLAEFKILELEKMKEGTVRKNIKKPYNWHFYKKKVETRTTSVKTDNILQKLEEHEREKEKDVKIIEIINACELSNQSVKLSNLGDHKSAVTHAKESIELLQNQYQRLLNKQVRQSQNKQELDEDNLKKMFAIKQALAIAHFNYGAELEQMKMLKEARNHYNSSLEFIKIAHNLPAIDITASQYIYSNQEYPEVLHHVVKSLTAVNSKLIRQQESLLRLKKRKKQIDANDSLFSAQKDPQRQISILKERYSSPTLPPLLIPVLPHSYNPSTTKNGDKSHNHLLSPRYSEFNSAMPSFRLQNEVSNSKEYPTKYLRSSFFSNYENKGMSLPGQERAIRKEISDQKDQDLIKNYLGTILKAQHTKKDSDRKSVNMNFDREMFRKRNFSVFSDRSPLDRVKSSSAFKLPKISVGDPLTGGGLESDTNRQRFLSPNLKPKTKQLQVKKLETSGSTMNVFDQATPKKRDDIPQSVVLARKNEDSAQEDELKRRKKELKKQVKQQNLFFSYCSQSAIRDAERILKQFAANIKDTKYDQTPYIPDRHKNPDTKPEEKGPGELEAIALQKQLDALVPKQVEQSKFVKTMLINEMRKLEPKAVSSKVQRLKQKHKDEEENEEQREVKNPISLRTEILNWYQNMMAQEISSAAHDFGEYNINLHNFDPLSEIIELKRIGNEPAVTSINLYGEDFIKNKQISVESLQGFGKMLKKIEAKNVIKVVQETHESQHTIDGGYEFFNGQEESRDVKTKFDSKFIMF